MKKFFTILFFSVCLFSANLVAHTANNELTSNQNIILSKEEAQSIAFMLQTGQSDTSKGLFIFLITAFKIFLITHSPTTVADILGTTLSMIPICWLGKTLIEQGALKVSLAQKIIKKMRLKKIDVLPETLADSVLTAFSGL